RRSARSCRDARAASAPPLRTGRAAPPYRAWPARPRRTADGEPPPVFEGSQRSCLGPNLEDPRTTADEFAELAVACQLDRRGAGFASVHGELVARQPQIE